MTVAEMIEALEKIQGHKEVRVHVFEDDLYDSDCDLDTASVEYRGADVVIEVK